MSGFVRLTWLIVLSCWVGCLTVEPSSAPAPEGDFLGDCDDQKNDLDGITDCEDPGCANNSACLDGNNSPGLVNNNDTAGDNSYNNNNTAITEIMGAPTTQGVLPQDLVPILRHIPHWLWDK